MKAATRSDEIARISSGSIRIMLVPHVGSDSLLPHIPHARLSFGAGDETALSIKLL
jgi:hypothetical protein